MFALRVFLVLVVGTVAINGTVYDITKPTEWWQTTTLYQIWPRSFKDSDGNGIGDLNGITSEIGHFVDMGIEVIWLSPFFSSPLADSGYDVSDFRNVNPDYGTLEDFDNLVATAKKFGLKVVLDYVPNHTSDEHEWFIKSKAGIEPYADYYVWNEGTLDASGTRQPPNNWLSVFNSGSAWEWVEERQAYYLHQFHVKQPDLDFRNPAVIQETKDILTFWLDRGIDGYRIDAVLALIEDDLLLDEPVSGLAGYEPTDYYYLDHVHTKDLSENYDIIQIWKNHIENYTTTKSDDVVRVMFTEAYANVSSIMQYYDHGSDIPFNFFYIKDNNGFGLVTMDTASDVVGIIDNWMANLPANKTANWVGSLDVQVINESVVAFARKLDGEQPIVVLINWDNTTDITISLDVFDNVPDKLEVLIADINSGITVGNVFEKTTVGLPANAAVVLRGIDG